MSPFVSPKERSEFWTGGWTRGGLEPFWGALVRPESSLTTGCRREWGRGSGHYRSVFSRNGEQIETDHISEVTVIDLGGVVVLDV